MERERLVCLGTGMDNRVNALAVSGTNLYAGDTSRRRAGWRPTTLPNGTGAPGQPWARDDYRVYALAVSGTTLYAGGYFSTAGGVTANYIAKWNESTWSALGAGMNNQVNALR